MARLFTGDYTTGSYNQWSQVINKHFESDAWRYASLNNYGARLVSDDPDCGYASRFEVRDGDLPGTVPGGERSEVLGPLAAYTPAGATRWFAYSLKFDQNYPVNRGNFSWGGPSLQFKNALSNGNAPSDSPAIGWGWGFETVYYEPDQYPLSWLQPGTAAFPIFQIPIDRGKWQDITMQIKFAKDSTGFIRVWRNGTPLTVLNSGSGWPVNSSTYGGGTTTFTGPNMIPDVGLFQRTIYNESFTGVEFRMGIYRNATPATPTEIISYKDLRIADTQDGL